MHFDLPPSPNKWDYISWSTIFLIQSLINAGLEFSLWRLVVIQFLPFPATNFLRNMWPLRRILLSLHLYQLHYIARASEFMGFFKSNYVIIKTIYSKKIKRFIFWRKMHSCVKKMLFFYSCIISFFIRNMVFSNINLK